MRLKAAVMVISVSASFIVGLFSRGGETQEVVVQPEYEPKVMMRTVEVLALPPSCQQALLGGADVISLSLMGSAKLMELLNTEDPAKSLELLDKYQKNYQQTHAKLGPYLEHLKTCQDQLGS